MAKVVKLTAEKVENYGLKPKLVDGYSVFTKESNRDFVILQLTDLHFGRGILTIKKDKLAHNAVVTLVNRVKPDLIILTGDNIYPIPIFAGTNNNMRQTKYVGELFDSFGIPWTTVFGNHESEPFATNTREELGKYYVTLKNCLFQNEEGIFGTGNHIIKLNNADGSLNTAFVMLDSNMYVGKHFFTGFDNIHDDQIEWYKNSIKSMSEKDSIAKSLAFFHMPPKEMRDAWEMLKLGNKEVTYHLGGVGEINDHVGYSRKKKGNFFEEMVKLGSCKGMFFGHDHLSNISLTYKGIRLTYGMSVDFLAYRQIMKKYTQRGGTVIKIKDDSSFTVELEPLTTIVKI